MAHCDDTTVLFRGGQQALAEMKQYARRLVTQGGMFNVKHSALRHKTPGILLHFRQRLLAAAKQHGSVIAMGH